MLPLFLSGRGSKKNPVWRVANGILNPVWARNLKEFSPVYTGYKHIFFSRERVNMFEDAAEVDVLEDFKRGVL